MSATLPALATLLSQVETVLVWGFVATIALTIVMYGSQGLGLSRLSLPYLFGTAVTLRRRLAVAFGLVLYMLGGWIFAFLYAWLFAVMHTASWWIGLGFGALHGLFLLVAFLPAMPYLHPHMASDYAGPSATRRLEPPGFVGLNYGRWTPLTTIVAHAAYGAILGATMPF